MALLTSSIPLMGHLKIAQSMEKPSPFVAQINLFFIAHLCLFGCFTAVPVSRALIASSNKMEM